jgi:hypothetical protein
MFRGAPRRCRVLAAPCAKCVLNTQQGGASYVNRPVVDDGNLVTARVWHNNAPLMKEFMAMLKRGVRDRGSGIGDRCQRHLTCPFSFFGVIHADLRHPE